MYFSFVYEIPFIIIFKKQLISDYSTINLHLMMSSLIIIRAASLLLFLAIIQIIEY